ncbi:MAG TPA: DNA topoisomerase III [Candidatus Methylacidiphilales bacterium]|jgi:DNA topoisomerase-3|nr:DNA topoisomerase III [Candidatus Methylacidiphilales bacterium]
MSKSLIIAEKPSVATDIAKAIGGFKKVADGNESYYESDSHVLSSAVGHLVELCLPGELDKQKGKWSFANLPVIPEEFALKPIERSEARLRLLKKLMKRADVTNLINACDAGREGELIFRYIVKLAGCKKPIQRLWLQSMTPASIRDGFAHLRPGAELESLASAAVCRSESDWLVGINGTRALTAFNSRNGGFQLTPVGRVQTPTLAIVVERDQKIKTFVPKGYWEVHATFAAKAGAYPGRWFKEDFEKPEDNPDARPERLWTEAAARAIEEKCRGKEGVVTEEKKPASQLSPLLYDLTTLQREANGRLGLSAKGTLQIAQRLYEHHKVLTYPRTDSRALPEDYIETVKQVLRNLKGGHLGPFASKILKEGWVKPTKRVFNNAKVSDHFAITPTLESPDKLNEIERKVYDMVAKRFLSVFYPAAEFEVTTRITRVEEEPFKTEGKILIFPGWLEIYGREEQGEDDPALVPVEENESVKTEEIKVEALATRPPAKFTEATLLSAMEGAGKLVEDEELREAMAAKGLGTPATRAATIEGLLAEEYLRREGRDIISTPKASALMELLHAVDIPALASPEMTGEWEYKLKQMERGELARSHFMKEIVGLTQTIVEKAKNFEESGFEAKPLGFNAPNGKPMVETLRNYQTEDKSVVLRKVIAGRLLEPLEAKDLLEKRLIGPLQGFRSRLGRPFAAALKLNAAGETEFVFDNTPMNADGTALDVNVQEPMGKCPICGGRVFETMMAFACENSFGDTPTCKMKIGKKILMQDIDRAQVEKLFTQKKTDLLRGFVSQRTRRKFSAYLVMGADGKTSFEFEPRAEGAKGRKPFAKKGTTPEANGHAEGKSVIPKHVIKAKGAARKRAPKKGE